MKALEAQDGIHAICEEGLQRDMDREYDDPVKCPIDIWRNFLVVVFPGLGGLLFGYSIGSSSAAVPLLSNLAVSGVDWGVLTALDTGLITSAPLLGAVIASLAAFLQNDKLGRKTELLMCTTFYGLGSIISTAAVALPMLIMGRIIYGLGIGYAMHGIPAYLAETGHPRIRGFLVSLNEVYIGMGIMLGYVVGIPCVATISGWRIVLGAALLPAFIMMAGMPLLPDSPRWLLLSGKVERAYQSLEWARGKASKHGQSLIEELKDIKEASSHMGATKGPFRIMQKQYITPMCIGLSLMFFQQVSGQPSVLYYATAMFQKAGLATGTQSTSVAGGMSAFKLICTCVTVFTVDKVGRRPLLLTGITGMGLSALLVGVVSLAAHNHVLATYTSIGALFIFVGSYQISFGPVSWLIVSEVFPLSVRGPGIALCTIVNFGVNFTVSLLLPLIERTFGFGGLFLGFACVAILAWVVAYFIVVETKQKTLEEIESSISG